MGKRLFASISIVLGVVTVMAAKPSVVEKLSDFEITHVISSINELEIKAAEIARKNATSQTVKDFADTMRNMHRRSSQALAKMEKSVVTPEVIQAAEHFKMETNNMVSDLQNAKSFDREYMASQVRVQANALKVLTEDLIPKTTSAELKKFFEAAKVELERNLKEAKSIQSVL